MEVPMFPSIAVPRRTTRLAKRLAQPFSKRNLLEAAHVMGPTLTALAFMGASSAVAHAQGTMDFSGAQTLMSTFKTFAMYAGAVICLGGLIFAGIRMMTGRFQDAIPGLFGALFGAGVLGWGAIGGQSPSWAPRVAIDGLGFTADQPHPWLFEAQNDSRMRPACSDRVLAHWLNECHGAPKRDNARGPSIQIYH
jgi:hypothetical protein